MNYLRTFALLAVISFFIAPLSFADQPLSIVQNTVDGMFSILEDEELSDDEKKEIIQKELFSHFDFLSMSKATIGRTWRRMSDEQRTKFTALFTEMMKHSFKDRIETLNESSSIEIRYLKEKVLSARMAQVQTLIKTSSSSTRVDYRLIKSGKNWMVYDFVIEGMSLLGNYRAQFRNLLRRKGVDSLITLLEEKVEKIKSRR